MISVVQNNYVANKYLLLKFFLMIFLFGLYSCGKNYTEEEKQYIEQVVNFRKEKDKYMKNNPASPFNFKRKVEFHPLNYYDVNPEFIFKSKLYYFQYPDTVIIYGTKGEARSSVRIGFLELNKHNKKYKLNVYKTLAADSSDYYSIWFTDLTTGEETYGVGRYIDFDLNPDSNYIYTIDFNYAYNPYCAYSADYSCAIPSKEDHLDLAIEAGEKNFHN